MSHIAPWWLAFVLTSCATNSTTLVAKPNMDRVDVTASVATTQTASSILPAITEVDAMRSRRDVLALIDERVQCGRSPERCDYERLAVPASPYDRELRALMKERVDFGLRTIAGKGAFRPTVTSIRLTSPGVAEVLTCVYDALVLYDTRTIPGVHIVFNDRVISIFSTWSMHLQEGRWKWFSEEVTRYAIERDAC